MPMHGKPVEFIRNRLYYATITGPVSDNATTHYFTTDNTLVYLPFEQDFGPLNLGQTYAFFAQLSGKMNDPQLKKKRIVYYSANGFNFRANSLVLLSLFVTVILGRPAAEVVETVKAQVQPPLVPFRDACMGPCAYGVTLADCCFAMQRAVSAGLFQTGKFSYEEYYFYSQVENGDLTWMLDKKIVAFAGPVGQTHPLFRYHPFTPSSYIPLFQSRNVTAVIRLNEACYDRKDFIRAGIHHYDLPFPDGSCPPDRIVREFFSIIDKEEGAVAVHCKAGLGRTGTLIALYLMQNYGFTAREIIAWLRILRPGSILGQQQSYLISMEGKIRAQLQGPSTQGPPAADWLSPERLIDSMTEELPGLAAMDRTAPAASLSATGRGAAGRTSATLASTTTGRRPSLGTTGTRRDATPSRGPSPGHSVVRPSTPQKSNPSLRRSVSQIGGSTPSRTPFSGDRGGRTSATGFAGGAGSTGASGFAANPAPGSTARPRTPGQAVRPSSSSQYGSRVPGGGAVSGGSGVYSGRSSPSRGGTGSSSPQRVPSGQRSAFAPDPQPGGVKSHVESVMNSPSRVRSPSPTYPYGPRQPSHGSTTPGRYGPGYNLSYLTNRGQNVSGTPRGTRGVPGTQNAQTGVGRQGAYDSSARSGQLGVQRSVSQFSTSTGRGTTGVPRTPSRSHSSIGAYSGSQTPGSVAYGFGANGRVHPDVVYTPVHSLGVQQPNTVAATGASSSRGGARGIDLSRSGYTGGYSVGRGGARLPSLKGARSRTVVDAF